MRNEIKDTKALVSTVITLVISVAVLIGALFYRFSFAWFVTTDQVKAEGISVYMERGSGANVEAVDIFKRTGAEDGAKRVYDSNNPGSSIEMTEYDTVFVDRNVNTPIVLRIVIDIVGGQTPEKVILTLRCQSNGWTTTGTASGTLLARYSNIIGARCGCLPNLTALSPDIDANAEAIYSGTINGLSAQTRAAFTTVNALNQNVSKVNEIVLEVDNVTMNSDNQIVLFMELDYIVPLTSAYVYQNDIDIDSGTSVAGQDIIPFPYDLEPFRIDIR